MPDSVECSTEVWTKDTNIVSMEVIVWNKMISAAVVDPVGRKANIDK